MFTVVDEDEGFTNDEITRLLNGEPLDVVTAAVNTDKFDGGMIALVPSDADVARLALDGYEPADELHLTLWYLGKSDFPDDVRNYVVDAVTEVAREFWPIQGNAFGVAHWNPGSDEPAWVVNVGDASDETSEDGQSQLATIRALIRSNLSEFDMPEQHMPWQPHICIAYSDEDLLDAVSERVGPVTFDQVRVAFGNDVTDVPLGEPVTLTSSLGGAPMPWHKVENHAACSAAEPWAVVQDDNDEVMGCHDTEQSADEQIAALYTNDEGGKMGVVSTSTFAVTGGDGMPGDKMMPGDGETPAGYQRVGDGSFMTDAEFEKARLWTGVLAVEGITTGDGREFAPGALTWADQVLIRWQKETAHGGEHDVTVTVGRADKVWRDGEKIMGAGVLDIKSPDGFEIRRRLNDGFAGGISIDADDIADADVEVVWPESPTGDEGDAGNPLDALFGRPEKIVYHGGRVRGATLVDIPAFVEATVSLVGDDVDALTAALAAVAELKFGAVGTHSTATSDVPWDVGINEKRLPSPMSVDTARMGYAWLDDGAVENGKVTKSAAKFLHHEVGADGKPGAANLTACSSGIGVLNGGRGGTTVPAGERQGIYDHLAAHLRDADREPPPAQFNDATLVAAAEQAKLDAWRPPSAWFENPGLSVPVGITITDQGRVYGHAAQWGECHVGFDDICVSPPVEDAHPYFMTGEVVCADGSHVAVGQITVATGHAPLSYRASRAAEHYDNTGSVVADVVVGNDEVGIWVAGAIRPHAESARVHDLRASGRVSGDWRRIGGELRLVGLLGVNVAGFHLRTRARIASGVPQSLVAAGFMTIGNIMTEQERDSDALKHVMAMLGKRILKEV
jgi:2'-5' RNA ligase